MKKRKAYKPKYTGKASITTLALFARHIYTGYMQFNLEGARETEKFYEQSVFAGDWQHERIRREILGMERYYKFEIHLYNHSGYLLDCAEYYPDQPLNHVGLADVIKQMSHELIAENNVSAIDLYKSYFRIFTYNPNQKEHL